MPLTTCWVVYDGDTIHGVYRSKRRASRHGTPVRSVLVADSLWTPVLHFVLRWLGYRDAGIRPDLLNVAWADVVAAEGDARRAVLLHAVTDEPVRATPPAPATNTAPMGISAQVEVDALRAQLVQLRRENAVLRQELAELEQQGRDVHTAAVVDITRTVGYLNAAMNAPHDAVHAYRAGMVYAAQVLSRPSNA